MRGCVVSRLACFVLAGLVATCSLPAISFAQTPLRFSLDGRIEGQAAPFFIALEKGYFKEEGLEVTIDPAGTPIEPITRVATGGYDLALGDINTLMRQREQNGAATGPRAVFILYNRPTYAVIGRKSRGVTAPGDLPGKKLGIPPAEHASTAWPIFAKATGIDVAKVTVLSVGLPIREPMLAAGEVDAVTGSILATPITLRDKGVPADDITVMQMADFGVELYGTAILANPKTLAEKPEAVRGFLRAVVRGLKEVIRDPSAAIASIVARGGGAPEVELERLTIALRESIVTPEARKNGIGGISAERFSLALDQLAGAGVLKSKPKVDDVFDAGFLPVADDRQLDGPG
jgi:NitT/TauT family transport system substrate-binding protein